MRWFESITRLILTNSELNTHGNRAEDLAWDRGWLEAQLCSQPQSSQRVHFTGIVWIRCIGKTRGVAGRILTSNPSCIAGCPQSAL
jgi:hypothetical protein